MSTSPRVEAALADHRGRLWGLCYRMSGSAADADDWLQDVFERVLTRGPDDIETDLGPWLTRVAMNVCRDHLRRRRHRGYAGPWLPGPIESSELWSRLGAERPGPEARYGQLESVSLAFLRALEALTPRQRAVLVLRDVLDHSVRETAEVLELSEAAVKTTHHRARAALADYEASRQPASPGALRAARRSMEAFMVHLALQNVDALRALVREDVVALNDGNGEYSAAQRPVCGRDKVLLFHRKVLRPPRRLLMCSLNGQPAMLVEFRNGKRRDPPRAAVWWDVDAGGRLTAIYAVVSDRKLQGLPWERARPASTALALRLLRASLAYPAPDRWLPGLLVRLVRERGHDLVRHLTASGRRRCRSATARVDTPGV